MPELVALRAALALPRHPIQIVATLNGLDLERALMFNVPALRVMLITIARGAEVMRDALHSRPGSASSCLTPRRGCGMPSRSFAGMVSSASRASAAGCSPAS